MSYDLLRFSLLFNRFVPSGTSPSPDTFHPDPTTTQKTTNHPTLLPSPGKQATLFCPAPPRLGQKRTLKTAGYGSMVQPTPSFSLPRETTNQQQPPLPRGPRLDGTEKKTRNFNEYGSMVLENFNLLRQTTKPPNQGTPNQTRHAHTCGTNLCRTETHAPATDRDQPNGQKMCETQKLVQRGRVTSSTSC